jgi:hypothetical protein
MNNSNPTNFSVVHYVDSNDGCYFVISKGKHTIMLNSNEVKQLVNALTMAEDTYEQNIHDINTIRRHYFGYT